MIAKNWVFGLAFIFSKTIHSGPHGASTLGWGRCIRHLCLFSLRQTNIPPPSSTDVPSMWSSVEQLQLREGGQDTGALIMDVRISGRSCGVWLEEGSFSDIIFAMVM